ncbi:hypothetical protein jhhlp_001948 [Lomentospora prolificans]|uniref:Uncharacterized protein n=1 Tax=Lomentospora prolificans TaxID=41688 RepID=A0A2N3NCP9_9PEZI|nr:hypothetical protein jhhlp_001948 [Lomentospora prolificans]
MSITQTYYLAHKARAKLAKEASRSDHNLRLLVGHANLLDCLMLELADAEREQESWFNQSVRGASKQEQEDIDYEDTIIEVPDEDWNSDSDSDSSSDESDCDVHEDDDVEMADIVSFRRVPVPDAPVSRIEEYDDDMNEDEDFADLGLVRTPSHSTPPELDDDSDTSEEETMPPSPPTAVLTFSEKETQEELHQQESSFYSQGFYVPARNPARLVSAIPIC